MDVEAVAQDAFAHLGVALNAPAPTRDGSFDLLVGPDVAPIRVVLKHRSLVDAKAAERLLAESNSSEHLLLVVGDRVTEDARRQILNAKAGYLDVRGHIGVRARGIVIDADVPAIRGDRDRTDALAGQAGMEVAANLLMNPIKSAGVRGLARTLGRSPSTVSGVLGALRRDGLINDANAVVGTALFWRMSEPWTSRRTFLVSAPDDADEVCRMALRMGLEDLAQPGWALIDTAAAAAYGAPVAFRAGQQLDFLVPDESVLQRSIRLVGPTTSATEAAISVRSRRFRTRPDVGSGPADHRSGRWPTRCSLRSTLRKTPAEAGRSWMHGSPTRGGPVSGDRVTFVGDAMATVIQGVAEVRDLIGDTPVIVGGLAVLSRLSRPYRATVDLDVVDRMLGTTPQLGTSRLL